jgi:hypothetical protein
MCGYHKYVLDSGTRVLKEDVLNYDINGLKFIGILPVFCQKMKKLSIPLWYGWHDNPGPVCAGCAGGLVINPP